jgi:hypothetical protein
MVLGLVGVMGLSGSSPAMAGSQDGGTFWTQFTPSPDTRLIFVSNSEGSDSNSGLTPATPVKSLARGYALLRDGHPDWMLLKRGDVWQEAFPFWERSGRSASELLVVGAYGEGGRRPQIRPVNAAALGNHGSGLVSHVAFVGLHMEPWNRADDQSPSGIVWRRRSENILFEDLYVAGFKDNFILQRGGDVAPIEDIRVNGCVSVNAWNLGGHAQGFFAKEVDGLVIENSVFVSNGFNQDRGAYPTIFNHNIYIQHGTKNVTVRNNIIADASSHGIQLRPGGTIEGNLFLSNPLNVWISTTEGMDQTGIVNRVSRNLVMYGRDLSSNHPRRYGIEAANLQSGTVEDNIIFSSPDGSNGHPLVISPDRGIRNVTVRNNSLVGWNGSVVFNTPSSTSYAQNIEFSGNRIMRVAADGSDPLVNLFSDFGGSVEVEGNSYHVAGSLSTPFRVGSTVLNSSGWIDSVEPDASFQPVSSGLPDLRMERYMASVGRQGGLAEFLEAARGQSRQTFSADLTPASVYAWASAVLAD